MSDAGMRMIIPDVVTANSSSVAPTTRAPATRPLSLVVRMPRTPMPARPFLVNSSSSVRLP